MYRSAAVWPQF